MLAAEVNKKSPDFSGLLKSIYTREQLIFILLPELLNTTELI